MLSIFPDLLTYGLLAPFIIRVALGLYVLALALRVSAKAVRRNDFSFFVWMRAIPAWIGGLLVISGFATQIGAVILLLWPLAALKLARADRPGSLFALIMALSLLFSGAGFFAFDMPL